MIRNPNRSGFLLRILPLAIGGLLLAGCGDDDGGSAPSPCDELGCDAAAFMQALGDSLAAIPDDADDSYIRTLRYPVIRQGFEAILTADPNNSIAHLGIGILEVLELNYDADLWALVDDMMDYEETWDSGSGGPVPPPATFERTGGLHLRPGSPILRNQFTILATAPREIMRRSTQPIPANLTVARLQTLIETRVIPALDRAITHLAAAEAGGPSMTLTVEDETVEIDLGDITMFHAATLATRAGFRMLTAYDLGLPGPDGTYGWVDTMRDMERCERWGEFELFHADSSLRVVVDFEGSQTDAAAESVAVAVLQYNLEQRTEFLAQRNSGMALAFADVRAMRDKVALAVASIRLEGDDQTDDIIKVLDLTDIDADIADTDPSDPNFAQSFTSIEDVLAWIDGVLSGPYLVSEDGKNGPIEFSVDLSAFFNAAPADWNALLPYHEFKPPIDWSTEEREIVFIVPESYGSTVSALDCAGVETLRTDVVQTRYERGKARVDPIRFLDSPVGLPIDLEVARIPYLPDYTIGGLFPGAVRDDWLRIHQNAGW